MEESFSLPESRRRVRSGMGALLLAVAAACAAPGATATASAAVPLPSTQLVPVGAGSTAFLATTFDLAADRYTEDEYFVSGTASIYAYDPPNDSEAVDQDVVVQSADVPYRTRMLVRRPTDPRRFDGTVVLEWLNPTAGFDGDTVWLNTYEHLIDDRAVWVGVTIKPIAVDFLEGWSPGRYGTLQMSDVGQAWDIVSQVSALLKTPSSAANPLRRYDVRRILQTGYSQSGSYLNTYANEFHDGATLPDGATASDGYYIAGAGGPKQINSADESGGVQYADERRLLRGNAPVIRSQSETEVINFGSYRARQPDSATYRLYELAGGSHVDAASNELLFGTAWARDLGLSPVTCANEINPIRIGHLEASSLESLERWVRDGTAPPPGRTLVLAGSPPDIARDADGNALGGVRLPEIDVPLGTYLPTNSGSGFCFLFGSFIPFDEATLDARYPSHGAYVRQIARRADAVVRQGYLLRDDARELRTAAAGSDVGR